MFKKLFFLMLALVIFFGISVCVFSQETSVDAMEKVFKSGKLVCAIELGTPPFCYKNPETGKIEGFVIDLVQLYAEQIGVEVELKSFDMTGLIPSLLTGQVDMLTVCLTRTPTRAGKMMFIEPFCSSTAHALVRKGTLSSLEELNDKNIVLTTTTGSIWEEIGEKLFPNAQMKTNSTNADNAVALQAKRADAYLNDKGQLLASMDMFEGQFEMIPEPFFFDSNAFTVRFDSPKLAHSMNIFMRLIKMDGTYNKIYKKWMEYDYVPKFEVGS